MLRFSQIAIALLTCVPALPAGAQSQPVPPDLPVVTVRGEGVVRMAPDRALVRVGAESRSRDPKEAQNTNAAAMSAVLQKITASGIPKDAIRTLVVSLQQEYDFSGGRQTPRGYLARNIVEVRVDDLARLGDVLDAVVSSGATMIHGLRLDVKLRSQFVAEALQSAVKSAMSKAQAIATGAGRAVDRVLKIEEVSGGEPVPMFRQMAGAARADATPVAPGELEIRAQVRLTIAIK